MIDEVIHCQTYLFIYSYQCYLLYLADGTFQVAMERCLAVAPKIENGHFRLEKSRS